VKYGKDDMPPLKKSELLKKLKKAKLMIMDVDGVLTDDKIYIGPDGAEFKRFDIGDGLATWFARQIKLQLAIISSRQSPATDTRARELRIDLLYQQHDKLASYEDLKQKTGVSDSEVIFVGNDLLDIPLMKIVGIKICTANSIQSLKRVCHYITKNPGGESAIREIIDLVLKSRGLKEEDFLK
jgi:3-deoxy-D-manno-octulosonate 8-phosphate phosphatase (KDO 8-P phosphatase)